MFCCWWSGYLWAISTWALNVTRQVWLVLQRLVSKDTKGFNPFETLGNLMRAPKWNLKRVIYRSLGLFVEGLGNVCKLKVNSSFEIIQELVQADVIDNDFEEDLLFSAAAACYLRLVRYAQKHRVTAWKVLRKMRILQKSLTNGLESNHQKFFQGGFEYTQIHCFQGRYHKVQYYEYITFSDLHYLLYSCCLLGQFSDAAVDSKNYGIIPPPTFLLLFLLR